MPRWCCLLVLLCSACAGGQTGEITMLGPCREALGEVGLDETSDAGEAATPRIARLTTEAEVELSWEDGSSSTLAITLTPTGDPAVVVGGEGCDRPFLDVPMTARISDGARLDTTLTGNLALVDDADGALAAEAPLDDALRPEGADPATAALRLVLSTSSTGLTGQLFTRASELDDEEPLGSF
ncbi:MAG: hypothetical protein AB8I08_27255 [Sandaracinaceae bacterium]